MLIPTCDKCLADKPLADVKIEVCFAVGMPKGPKVNLCQTHLDWFKQQNIPQNRFWDFVTVIMTARDVKLVGLGLAVKP